MNYLTPAVAKRYVLRWLRAERLVPADPSCRWSTQVRVIPATAVHYPDSLSVHVYGWPVSREADVEPLAAALGRLPGVLAVQRWPDRAHLRPCVRIYLDRWRRLDDLRAAAGMAD